MKEKRILFVFAHPDDETFTSGGTIAHYTQDINCEIHLLCATRGEAGKTGEPPQCKPEELARVRENELLKASSILGIHSVKILDYHDGRLSEIPTQELAEHIKKYLKSFNPQVIITFPPHGISGHQDHQAIQKATFQAVSNLTNNQTPRKLYYTILPESTRDQLSRPVQTDPDDQVDTVIDVEKYNQTVAQALSEHKTQNISVNMVFPGVLQGDFSSLRKKNYFHLAWTNIPSLNKTTSLKNPDLFNGIRFSG